jgi:3-dehydroquinate synthase
MILRAGCFFRPPFASGFKDENDRQNFDTAPSIFILGPCAPFPSNWANRSYAIKIAPGLIDQLGRECARLKLGARCAIITDTNVGRRFAKQPFNSLATTGFSPSLIVVPAGETAKSLKTVQTCYDLLAAHRLERKSFIVALGGGVVGDLAGFVAATYLRGIAFVQVPTTLLAQVDSSVGGKVGVNLKAGKNLVGAFYQPRLVLCDLDTLRTLPEREFRAGLAEVIKYGIIYDAKLFAQLERDLPKLLRREPKRLSLSSRAAAKSRRRSSARTKRKAACARS